jgi:predicted DsbA family dithiol-disulfide isomerase
VTGAERLRAAAVGALALLLGCGPHASQASPGPVSPRPPAAETAPGDSRGHCSLPGLRSPLIGPTDAQWGAPTAPVAIVVFSDFECPYCAMGRESLEHVRDRYSPTQVRIVWKHSPLRRHPNARPAAEAAEGVRVLAGNDAFWRFHDLAFADQRSLTSESYARWAEQAGLRDLAALAQGQRDGRFSAKVSDDLELGRQIGIKATPSFVINGSVVEGAQPLDELAPLIDAELGAAGAGAPGFACARMGQHWKPTAN